VTFAEDNTPGTPAPGWLPAPTKYRLSNSLDLLEYLKYALCLKIGCIPKPLPLNAFSSF